MPEPVPAPTPSQIVTVAEITMLSTDAVTAMVAADSSQDISNAKWALTLEDIAAWPAIRDEEGDIRRVGSIEFFENAGIKNRLGFRNRIRSRYGQLLLVSESASGTARAATASVEVTNDY